MIKKIIDYTKSIKVEMKKVSWLSKKEIFGSTMIVGIFAIFIAVFFMIYGIFWRFNDSIWQFNNQYLLLLTLILFWGSIKMVERTYQS